MIHSLILQSQSLSHACFHQTFTLMIMNITFVIMIQLILLMLSVRGLITIWGRVAASGGFGAPHDLHPPSTAATSSCSSYEQLF